MTPEHLGDLIALGREIKWALNDTEHAVHPTDPRLNGIYGTIWFDELGDAAGEVHQRNVTIFADGEVDRSPCGSGTSARLAVLAADGRLPAGTVLRHDSIVGSTFTGTVLDTVDVDGRAAVIPQVTGHGVPDRRARLLDRSARPARPRVRAAVRYLDAAAVAALGPPRRSAPSPTRCAAGWTRPPIRPASRSTWRTGSSCSCRPRRPARPA